MAKLNSRSWCPPARTGAHPNKRLKMSDWFERAMAKTAKNPKTGCWEYAGEIVHNGYGRIFFNGRNVRVHRLSYLRFKGPIPSGLLICHKCDVRHCWNPDHLFVGTSHDNIRDMIQKGRSKSLFCSAEDGARQFIGSSNGRSKLTESAVSEIRELASQGVTHRALAKRFGVSGSAIFRALHKRSWGHV